VPWIFFVRPDIEIIPPRIPWNFDPIKGPGKPWVQRFGPKSNWFNPETGESVRWDQNHPSGIRPHNDYWPGNGRGYRWFDDGTIEPKIRSTFPTNEFTKDNCPASLCA
jgi:hypothetical protein